MKKITGSILILAAAILYFTEHLCNSLLTLSMATTGTILDTSPVYSWPLVILAMLLLIMGLFLIIKKE